MKVWFLIHSRSTPSSRIRVLELLPSLHKQGIETDVDEIPVKFFQRRRLLKKAGQYQIVVLQKKLLSGHDLNLLRKHTENLIFDFDDAIYFDNASPSNNPDDYHNPESMKRFKHVINSADMIITSNSQLQEKVREINSQVPIHIIPSSVEANGFVKENYQLNNPPVFGWIGLRSNFKYLEFIAPALVKMAEDNDFILRVIAESEIKISGLKIEFREWRLETQYEEIKQFDLGIMPLTSDPFSEGKSAYKLLQYLSVGVPAVASAVGMNKEIGEDEKNCLLADSPEMFMSKIQLLLNDIQLRGKLGENGRKAVEEKYTRDIAGNELGRVLVSSAH